MSRSNPAWPTPLLALDPIRLRPMGWLDDLLPMRPPSLWRDRSLYARALRWQPDTADLSWLFDAYAMLGIEMPPPRIEHRTHQRSPQRGRLKGAARQTHIRRRRAPIKGGNRPLTIPRWSSPPQMVSPQRRGSQDRVESSPSFRSRKQVSPSTLPAFQWRSPERVAPAPTFSRPVQGQVAPNLGSQPTLLRKEDSTVESRPSPISQEHKVDRSVREQRPQQRPTVLSSRQPTVQQFPTASPSINRPRTSETVQTDASPPPKVTWQRQHTRSPWRLNHTGRTLLNPQSVTRTTSEGVSSTSVNASTQSSDDVMKTKPKRFADRVVQIGKVTSSTNTLETGFPSNVRLRREVQQVEWTQVRKGTIQSAVLEQGKIRQIQPAVQMDLPPSPRSIESERVRKSQSPVSPVGDASSTAPTPKAKPTDSRVPPVKKRSSKPQRVEEVVFQAGRVHRMEALRESRQVLHTPSGEQSTRRLGTVVAPKRESFTAQPSSVQKRSLEVARRSSPQQVQVPNRVPWRLKPSDRQIIFRGSKPVFEQQSSTLPSKSSPIAEATRSTQISREIPSVPSWFRPERQRLIRHFEDRRIQRQRPRLEVRSEPLRTEPLYGFSNPQQGGERRFRATEQTMVAPLRAGTLVFPTPMGDVETTRPTSEKSEPSQKNRGEQVSTSDSSKSNVRKGASSSAASTTIAKSKQPSVYPEPKIQQNTGYQRRKVDGIQSRWRLRKTGASSKSLPPLMRLTNTQSTQHSWRLPQISVDSRELNAAKTLNPRSQSVNERRTTKSVFRAPTPFWQGAFQRSSVQYQSPMVYPTPQSADERPLTKGQSSLKKEQSAVQNQTVSVRKTSSSTQIRIPIQTERGLQRKPITHSVQGQRDQQSVSKRIRAERTPIRSVSWSRKPRFADPFAAHRQSVLSKTPLEVLSPTNASSQSVSSPIGTQTKKVDTPSPTVVARTQKKELNQSQKVAPTSMLKAPSIPEIARTTSNTTTEQDSSTSVRRTVVQAPISSTGSRSLQAPTSQVSPVRRVVAPTLSPSLVYSATVSEQKRGVRTPTVGKYGQRGSTGVIDSAKVGTGRADTGGVSQPKGKYGPSSTSVAEQKRGPVGDTSDVSESSSQAVQDKDTIGSMGDIGQRSVEAVVEQAVQRQVQRLVRRLPKTQQSLLRSRIALPTRWARKLGLAPTAEIKMGWRLQHSERTAPNTTRQPVVPNVQGSGAQQFVVPTSESPKDSSVSQRVQIERADSVSGSANPTRQSSIQTTPNSKQKPRRLTNAQVNRIIERQVSFFRSAQRQSFLRASQLTNSGSSAIPSPARSGLQKVTGEMRQALQRMVFSSDAQPVFLDTLSEPIVENSRTRLNSQVVQKSTTQGYQQSSVGKSSNSKKNVHTRMRRLQSGPQWRPGVHSPTSLRKPVQTVRQVSSDGQTTNIEKRPISQASSFSRSVSASPSTPSIVRTPSKPQSAPVATAQSMTVLQNTVAPEDVRDTIESVSPEREVPSKSKQGSPSPREARRKVPARRGSTPMAPRTLMGRSEVGVFLKPKKTASDQPENIPAPKRQSSDSVDSDADVFMVDAAGNLLTGDVAKKRLKDLGFARSESVKPKAKPNPSSTPSSYTWEAPEGMMEEAIKQVRKEQMIEQQVKKPSRAKATRVRQSVIKEWTEEQLLTILVELAGSSPEANALLRDVQDRVEEYFDLEHFRKI